MESIFDVLGIGVSAASGGLFGFAGAIVSGIFKYLHVKEERAAIREEREYEKDMLKLQMQAKSEETEQELAIVSQEGSWTAMEVSHRSDAETSKRAPSWANGVKTLFRPFLTTLLVVAAGVAFKLFLDAINDKTGMIAQLFTHEEQVAILKYMINTTFFTASTAVVWWYGERGIAPPGMKNR